MLVHQADRACHYNLQSEDRTFNKLICTRRGTTAQCIFMLSGRFMFLWGPITLIILTHLLSNKPFSSSSVEILSKGLSDSDTYINSVAGGVIHLGSMTIISFVMFVLFKVAKSTEVHSLFQHMTLASFVGLITIIFSLICSSGITALIILSALVYILISSYLHINAYNQALKPQLIELVFMAALILFFYSCTGTFLLNKLLCFINITLRIRKR